MGRELRLLLCLDCGPISQNDPHARLRPANLECRSGALQLAAASGGMEDSDCPVCMALLRRRVSRSRAGLVCQDLYRLASVESPPNSHVQWPWRGRSQGRLLSSTIPRLRSCFAPCRSRYGPGRQLPWGRPHVPRSGQAGVLARPMPRGYSTGRSAHGEDSTRHLAASSGRHPAAFG